MIDFDYCEICIHFRAEEITKGLYEYYCDLDNDGPEWNEDEECKECEDFKSDLFRRGEP